MMVNIMKWAVSLLCCLNLASAAELALGRTIYVMPMGRGLDQFIANRLTRMHVMQVVTDPGKADAVLTDEVDASFPDRLKALNPPPPPASEAKKEKDKDKEDAKAADANPSTSTQSPTSRGSRRTRAS